MIRVKTVLVVATLDTKGTEVAFCREQIEALGAKVLLMDGGVLGKPTIKPDITREEVAAAAGTTIEQVIKSPSESEAIGLQAQGAGVIALRLYKEGKIHGVLGIGGGMGTTLGTGVMRALPIGVPKFMVSSQAGNPAMSPLGRNQGYLYVPLSDRCGGAKPPYKGYLYQGLRGCRGNGKCARKRAEGTRKR